MLHPVNMLLVDDDESIVCLLTRIIRNSFHKRLAFCAMTDPVAAKHWIQGNSPDLVLTDFQMPEVDGLEILKCAKRQSPNCQVIIHSGCCSTAARDEAIDLGASDYVAKSTDPEKLLQALEHAYGRLTQLGQAWAEIVPSQRPQMARSA